MRVPFPRPCMGLNDALSSLTMLAQQMWEEEKQYMPVPVLPSVDEDDEDE